MLSSAWFIHRTTWYNFILHGQYGHSPHTDEGLEVRRVFHKLRSIAMENFHEHFSGRGLCSRPFPFALEFVEPRDDD